MVPGVSNNDSIAGVENPEPQGWAKPTPTIEVSEVPSGATNINIEGRKRSGAMQGFGRLWQKTYRVRLEGVDKSPIDIMLIWKAKFADFQPPENHFYPPMTGIKPNDVLFIEAKVPAFPGTPSILPIASGVTVLYVDDTMFTVMTPEGFPVAGWNTFSVFEDDGVIIAQVQSFERASDPVYEIFDRFFGAGSQQEKIWIYVLANLAKHLGIDSQVELQKVCLDGKLQWSRANNIWNNAGARTVLYKLSAPVRWTKAKLSKR